jgi:hypothetical protein
MAPGKALSISPEEGTMMRQRTPQSGSAKLQTLVILTVVVLVGMVAVPVWVSRAAGPRDVVLKANTRTVAATVATVIMDSPSPSPLATPGPQSAALIRDLFSRPVVNPVSHSKTIMCGAEWRTDGAAPAVWVTSRTDAGVSGITDDSALRAALAGTIIVHVGADGSVDVFAVPSGGQHVSVLQHMAATS